MTAAQSPQVDQLAAATAEAAAALGKAAKGGGRPSSPASGRFVRWFRRALLTAEVAPCLHVGPSPHVLIAAFTAPDRAVIGCPPCVRAALAGPADRTCDRCARVMPAGRDWSCPAFALGPAVWSVGLCPPCATAVDAPMQRAEP